MAWNNLHNLYRRFREQAHFRWVHNRDCFLKRESKFSFFAYSISDPIINVFFLFFNWWMEIPGDTGEVAKDILDLIFFQLIKFREFWKDDDRVAIHPTAPWRDSGEVNRNRSQVIIREVLESQT